MPILIFGAASLVAGALVMFLPETKGKPLPENTQEAINLSSGVSIRHFLDRIFKRGKNRIAIYEDGITSVDVKDETTRL